MQRFTISNDKVNLGFQEYVRIDLSKPVVPQLRRRRLTPRLDPAYTDVEILRNIINTNSSLRVSFGWSFETDLQLREIMQECMETVALSYNEYAGTMMSDMSCDWIGFVPHNVYDREVYKDLSMYGLIVFNNDMVSFQEAVIEFITNHPMYKDHAILRDEWYRFQYFKMLRKDPIALAAAYRHYIDAAKNTCLIHEVPKDILETQIGVHFLHHPDLFFELLEFSILKGEIYV